MNKLFYPALFHTAEEGGFWVSFPDFPECLTQGDNPDQAYEMAMDALGLCITDMIKENTALPEASSPSAVAVPDGCFLVVIGFDLAAYNRKHNSRAVKKTLSIPEWLNESATSIGINFSQVLQEALMERVQQAGMK